MAHLGPMSAAEACSELCVVTTSAVPAIPKVTVIRPRRWLVRALGATLARQVSFAWRAIRTRPDIVGGFHLLPNGLVSALLGRLVGARPMYICTGGPAEVIDGGIRNDTGPFTRMETPDPVVEGRLIRGVKACDLVITRGTRAVRFFRNKGVHATFCIVTGGIDSGRFSPATDSPSIDLVFSGRLAGVKRIDVLLKMTALVRLAIPTIKVAIVGDGPLKEQLWQMSRDLGLDSCVEFAGHQQDVSPWLLRSKLFVLPSRNEGLSLAMIEAMMCGLPAVVSDVGDLADLVEHGVNGFLVPVGEVEKFAAHAIDLLTDARKYSAFSEAARRSALRHSTTAITRQWDMILGGVGQAAETACQEDG